MGCAPSQSSIDIFVEEQHCSPRFKPGNKPVLSSPSSSRHDSFLEKNSLQDEDIQDEDFLQESMKSCNSQASTKSNTSYDSGLYDLDDEYSNIITENSDPNKVLEVNKQFIPAEGLELLLEGKACPRKLSSKDRDKAEQQIVLDVLREEGLSIIPASKSVGGIRFDFVPAAHFKDSSLYHKLPPINMRKKYRRKKAELTFEEIEQKLIKAEERRKKKIEEKLQKLSTKDPQEIQTIMQQEAEVSRQKIEEKQLTKMLCREKHLIELRDKLKAKEEHAKKVRQRKQMQENGFKYILPT